MLAAKNRYSQPSAPLTCASLKRPRLLMKRCESANQRGRRSRLFELKPSHNKTRGCLRAIKRFPYHSPLNPKRFVSGRYWGGLKQPPRRAARDPLGRGAPLRGQSLKSSRAHHAHYLGGRGPPSSASVLSPSSARRLSCGLAALLGFNQPADRLCWSTTVD